MKKCTCLYKAGCGRTLGDPPPTPWGGPRRRGWSLTHLCLYLLPPPFPPNPPGTSSALPPSECIHTPIPWEVARWLCHFPHTPGGGSQGQPGPLPCNCFAPLGQTKGALLCTGRVQEGVSSSYHCYSRHKWNSSSSRWLLDGMPTGSGWTCLCFS